jgi:hypothetical protein
MVVQLTGITLESRMANRHPCVESLFLAEILRKFPVIPLSAGKRKPGDRFRRTASATTQSAVSAFCRDCRERPAIGGVFRLRLD